MSWIFFCATIFRCLMQGRCWNIKFEITVPLASISYSTVSTATCTCTCTCIIHVVTHARSMLAVSRVLAPFIGNPLQRTATHQGLDNRPESRPHAVSVRSCPCRPWVDRGLPSDADNAQKQHHLKYFLKSRCVFLLSQLVWPGQFSKVELETARDARLDMSPCLTAYVESLCHISSPLALIQIKI